MPNFIEENPICNPLVRRDVIIIVQNEYATEKTNQCKSKLYVNMMHAPLMATISLFNSTVFSIMCKKTNSRFEISDTKKP